MFFLTFISRLDMQCEGVESEMNHLFPAFSAEHAECGLQQDPLLFSCAGSSAKLQRLCPCRDYREGQVALCRDCLWPGEDPWTETLLWGEHVPFASLLRFWNAVKRCVLQSGDSAPFPPSEGPGCQSRYHLSGNCMIVLWTLLGLKVYTAASRPQTVCLHAEVTCGRTG